MIVQKKQDTPIKQNYDKTKVSNKNAFVKLSLTKQMHKSNKNLIVISTVISNRKLNQLDLNVNAMQFENSFGHSCKLCEGSDTVQIVLSRKL